MEGSKKLMEMFAKIMTYDEIVGLIEEHILLYKSKDPKGRSFLSQSCTLLIIKEIAEAEEELASMEGELDQVKQSMSNVSNSNESKVNRDIQELMNLLKNGKTDNNIN